MLAQVLDVAHVVLVTADGPQAFRCDRIDLDATGPHAVASVLVSGTTPLTAEHAQEAARALLAEASLDLQGPSPRPIEPWQPPPQRLVRADVRDLNEPTQPTRLQRGLGFALVGGGAVAASAAFVLFQKHRDQGRDFRGTLSRDDHYLARQRTWQDSRSWGYLAMAPAAAITTAGIALGTARPLRRPSLAWASGGVGLALLAWGITDISLGGSCTTSSPQRSQCVLVQEQRDRGALVALTALPLL